MYENYFSKNFERFLRKGGIQRLKTPIETWFRETLKAEWKSPSDVKLKYRNASFLINSRVVFNIHGNKYRLVVKIHYNLKTIYIRFIGTHEQYDKINAEEI